MKYQNILVTGGCGFIGSNFLNQLVHKYPQTNFYNIDKLDYCATVKNVADIAHLKNYKFFHGDILDEFLILKILNIHKINAVVHFAAQSHVDNSFGNSLDFTLNNVLGTHKLLEACRIYGKIKRFIHISTDEVYGEVEKGESLEHSTLDPTNPYSATKAAAEFIVKSYYHSFKMPIIITRGNNVYGPRQYPEKVIPKFIYQLLNGEKCPIHGDGHNIRNFIYTEDTVDALEIILEKGRVGQIYNIGSKDEFCVMDIAKVLVDKLKEDADLRDWIEYVDDRKFNDIRYSVCCDKLEKLGWKKKVDFEDGLARTIDWYRNHLDYFEN